MVACIKVDVDGDATPDQTITTKAKGKEKGKEKEKEKRKGKPYACLAEILVPRGSPYSMNNSDRHIVIVLDPLKNFSRLPLQWTLDHVVPPGCTVTFLGVMNWLPFAFSSKAWTYDFGNMLALKGRSEWRNEEIRWIIELCEEKGVIPYMQLAMGNSLKLVVLEKASSLHATLVVLDRRHRRHKAFFAERLPSSVVMMNSDGGVDMIKVQSTINCCDSSPDQEYSPAPPPPTKVIYSEALTELLNQDPEKPVKNISKNPERHFARTRREMGLFFGEAVLKTLRMLV